MKTDVEAFQRKRAESQDRNLGPRGTGSFALSTGILRQDECRGAETKNGEATTTHKKRTREQRLASKSQRLDDEVCVGAGDGGAAGPCPLRARAAGKGRGFTLAHCFGQGVRRVESAVTCTVVHCFSPLSPASSQITFVLWWLPQKCDTCVLIIGAIWKAESNATSIAKLVETLDKDCDKVKPKKKGSPRGACVAHSEPVCLFFLVKK